MDSRKQFELFLKADKTEKFIQFFDKNVSFGYHPSYNYFGVNFLEDELVSIKLYYSFFKIRDINIIKAILPHTDEFDQYYSFYKESDIIDTQNQGCTFTLKANSNLDFTIGFGFRFPLTRSTPFEQPEFIQLTDKDLLNYQGICFEYSGNNIVKKRNYYYITDIVTKQKIAEEWNNESIAEAEVIEYTETGSERKIIIWNYDITNLHKKASIFLSDKHKAFNEWIKTTYNVRDLIDGEYLSRKEKASYFYRLNELDKGPYDLNLKGSIDTIKCLLEKKEFSS